MEKCRVAQTNFVMNSSVASLCLPARVYNLELKLDDGITSISQLDGSIFHVLTATLSKLNRILENTKKSESEEEAKKPGFSELDKNPNPLYCKKIVIKDFKGSLCKDSLKSLFNTMALLLEKYPYVDDIELNNFSLHVPKYRILRDFLLPDMRSTKNLMFRNPEKISFTSSGFQYFNGVKLNKTNIRIVFYFQGTVVSCRAARLKLN